MKIRDWIFPALFWGCVACALVWRSQNPIVQNPEEEKAAKANERAEQLKIELQYEHEFYEDEAKNIKEGSSFPTIARVVAPNGGIVTGRMLFISQCPPKRLCAQPDGSLEDEDGDDWNHPE